MVSELRFADMVILEASMAQKVDDIQKYHADVFILGDDYKETFKQMAEYEKVSSMRRVIFCQKPKWCLRHYSKISFDNGSVPFL